MPVLFSKYAFPIPFVSPLQVLLQEHEGSLDEDGHSASDLLEVHLDGPSTESDVAKAVDFESKLGVPGLSCQVRQLQLTDFSRRCVETWVRWHGRRFGCYRKRKDIGVARDKNLLNKGSFAAVQARQRNAVRKLLSEKVSGESLQSNLLGCKLDVYANRSTGSALNDKMQRFQKLTAEKKTEKARWRDRDNDKPMPMLRRADVFTKNNSVFAVPKSFAVLDLTGEAAHTVAMPGKMTKPKLGPGKASIEEIQQCQLMLVHNVEAFEQMILGTLVCLQKKIDSIDFVF